MIWFIAGAFGGYLLGSIPFGLLITRIAGLGDIRQIGSGNIGATNVLRTGRKDLALATLLLDSFKAGLAVLVFTMVSGDRNVGLIAGAFACLGHCYPIWLGFKGGKGVATFLGTVLALSPIVGIAACALWLATFASTRISSLGGIMAPALSPVAAYLLGHGDKTLTLAAMAIFVWWRHRENIARILNGTEPKVGQKKPEDTA